MILLDVIVVALSNIPLGCFIIYASKNCANRPLTPTEGLFGIVTQLIGTAQASGSFYFYVIVSSALRTNVKIMLSNVLCFWKPRTTNQIAASIGTALAVQTKIPTVVA